MKTIVLYYSNTGSNKYLAEKVASALSADLEAIKPRVDFFPLLMFFSLTGASAGIEVFDRKLEDYDRIILCGPIWMGQLVSPLRDFLTKYRKNIKELHFVTCCASADAAKEMKFGHALVFRKVQNILKDKCASCDAFPIGMVLPEDKQKDNNAILKTRLSDDNFSGEIQKRFENVVRRLAA
jgi:menaquinone-dependent protoporphyrinogen IX oxidase